MRSKKVGVIVARFQVPDLHDGHRYTIEHVRATHERVVIVLGVSVGFLDIKKNPLGYEMRKEMIKEIYSSSIRVLPLEDCPGDDHTWSKRLDAMLRSEYPEDECVLYGSRESFLKVYSGDNPVYQIAPIEHKSGTEYREAIARSTRASSDFRAGIIHAVCNRPPTVHQEVFVAVFRPETNEVAVIKSDSAMRFPSRFMTPDEDSFEGVAMRIIRETYGCPEVENLSYVGSLKANGQQHHNGTDSVMRVLFYARYVFGSLWEHGNSVSAEWIPVVGMEMKLVNHEKPFCDMLKGYLTLAHKRGEVT